MEGKFGKATETAAAAAGRSKQLDRLGSELLQVRAGAWSGDRR
jgi:hypothetical protein